MNVVKKSLCTICVIILALGIISPAFAQGTAENQNKEVEILFTNDIHSHLRSFSLVYDGQQQKMGGLARAATVIKQYREKNENLLLLDGGDFSMGTLFQTLFTQKASELRMLGYLGYDAVTIGNHEFDYGESGLLSMFQAAENYNSYLPEMLVCNAKVEGTAFENYFKDYMIKEVDGIKIAILGVFGSDALSCAPDCPISFEDPVHAVKETVEEIKEKEAPDLIICLSHSGVWEDISRSEDQIVAKKVPDLDVIISAHTHTFIEEAMTEGNTTIVSAGEYASRIGHLIITQDGEGNWKVKEYELIPLTEDIKEDEDIEAKVQEFEKGIDKDYLEQFGYTMDQVLTTNSYTFTSTQGIGTVLQDENLGNLLSDAMRWCVEQSDPEGDPVDVAVVPAGLIRDTIPLGEVTVSDAFNISALGIGSDGITGYPVISVYLTGKELKAMVEIDASISPMMPIAQLYLSGLHYTANTNRILLNRVVSYSMCSMDGEMKAVEDDRLYHVVADYFSGQMLSSVTDMSKGVLSIVPKDAQGNPIEDMKDAIIYEGNQELKAWVTLARYLDSFEKVDGVSEIPARYKDIQGRKEISHEISVKAMVTNINFITITVVTVVILVLAIIGVVATLIIKKVKRKKNLNSIN